MWYTSRMDKLNNFKNSNDIMRYAQCGCYFCVEVIEVEEVVEFTDNGETALCPKCGIDSLIPNETNLEYLGELCEKWFTGMVPIDSLED